MYLSWGKPTIELAKITNGVVGAYTTIPTPAVDTTKLTPTAGDKKEAEIEGGDLEDVKYGKNKYQFEFQIRKAKDKNMPISHEDGIILDEYAIRLTPEDQTVEGIQVLRARFHVEDSYTTADGETWKYVADALSPSDGGPKVREYDATGTATVVLESHAYNMKNAITAINSNGGTLSVSATRTMIQAAFGALASDKQTAVITALS